MFLMIMVNSWGLSALGWFSLLGVSCTLFGFLTGVHFTGTIHVASLLLHQLGVDVLCCCCWLSSLLISAGFSAPFAAVGLGFYAAAAGSFLMGFSWSFSWFTNCIPAGFSADGTAYFGSF